MKGMITKKERKKKVGDGVWWNIVDNTITGTTWLLITENTITKKFVQLRHRQGCIDFYMVFCIGLTCYTSLHCPDDALTEQNIPSLILNNQVFTVLVLFKCISSKII
jgi:hypothetical protein